MYLMISKPSNNSTISNLNPFSIRISETSFLFALLIISLSSTTKTLGFSFFLIDSIERGESSDSFFKSL